MLLMRFRIIYELIIFALQFAFIYGLAFMAFCAFVIWALTGYTPPEVSTFIEPMSSLICERIEGCSLIPEATTPEEYCPSCVRR